MKYLAKIKKGIKDYGLLGYVCHVVRILFLIIKDKLFDRRIETWYSIFRKLPVNKGWVVLESEGDFTDNTRALYEYMKEHCSGHKYIWLVQHPEQFQDTEDTIFTSFFDTKTKLRSYYYIARSAHIFYTHNMIRPFHKRKGQTIYKMTHGFGFKGQKGVIFLTNQDVDGVIDLGPLPAKVNAGPVFDLKESEILPLGYPRNDLLINTQGTGKDNQFVGSKGFKKVILLMPTFRASWSPGISEMLCDTETGLPLLETQEQLSAFNSYLARINVCFILKVHHLQADKEIFKQEFSNILILKDEMLLEKGLQLYEMVGKTDALITDYSSIAYDYMLINKPIGFILDDVEKYRESRGLLIDNVEDYMPGDHIYNIEQLHGFVESVLRGEDAHAAEREKLKPQILGPADNHACERIVKYFNL